MENLLFWLCFVVIVLIFGTAIVYLFWRMGHFWKNVEYGYNWTIVRRKGKYGVKTDTFFPRTIIPMKYDRIDYLLGLFFAKEIIGDDKFISVFTLTGKEIIGRYKKVEPFTFDGDDFAIAADSKGDIDIVSLSKERICLSGVKTVEIIEGKVVIRMPGEKKVYVFNPTTKDKIGPYDAVSACETYDSEASYLCFNENEEFGIVGEFDDGEGFEIVGEVFRTNNVPKAVVDDKYVLCLDEDCFFVEIFNIENKKTIKLDKKVYFQELAYDGIVAVVDDNGRNFLLSLGTGNRVSDYYEEIDFYDDEWYSEKKKIISPFAYLEKKVAELRRLNDIKRDIMNS